MTVIFWAIVGLAWLGFGVGLSNGSSLQAGGMLAGGALLAALGVWLRMTQPVAYRIERDGVVIERRRGETRIDGVVGRHVEDAVLGLRLGSGGLYGYRGRFRVNGKGWARAFVTDARRAALIDVGGRPTVLSPVDPAALVAEVAHA